MKHTPRQPVTRPASPFRGGVAGASDLLTYIRKLEHYADHLEQRLAGPTDADYGPLFQTVPVESETQPL